MTGPGPIGVAGVGRVNGARLEANGDAFADKHPVADPAMNAVVREGIARIIGEPQARVAAEDIEEVVVASQIDYQAGASERERGSRAP